MKKPIINIVACASIMLFGTLGATSSVYAADQLTKESVMKMIADADMQRKKAASVGGEWRDTSKILEDAETILEKGDLEWAAKLAKRANQHSVLGYEQAMSQSVLKMPSYLKY